jgi:SAM-dependent methyltransferase
MSTTFTRPVDECPGCGAPAAAARALLDLPFAGAVARLLECPACGLCYKSLAPTQAGLDHIYASDYEHFADGGSLDLGELYSAKQKLASARRVLGSASSPGEIRVLDIGCGSGRFVELARRLGYRAEGIDPYLPARMESDHLHRGEPGDLTPATFDIALMLNVAEHLIDPHPLFRAARRILRSGGVLLITCPYGGSLARRLHGARWIHLTQDEHLLFWTPRSLSTALRADGFLGASTRRIAGSPFPYGLAMPAAPVRAETQASPAETSRVAPTASPPPPRSQRVQREVWRVARALMRRESVANAIRRVVHLTHSGDYLELVIATA